MTVYLVGAGPGDPGLLTVRGAELLNRADVVVHDRLAESSLLELAPPDAERIDVGKAPGAPVRQVRLFRCVRQRFAFPFDAMRRFTPPKKGMPADFHSPW